MRIAVVGGHGILGRGLDQQFRAMGCEYVVAPPRAELDFARSADNVRAWLSKTSPDAIISLLGATRTVSENDLLGANVVPMYTLLHALHSARLSPRIVVTSSAAVYGEIDARVPIVEEMFRRPVSAYGTAKALQEDLCALYRMGFEQKIIIARIFNVVGNPFDQRSVLPALFCKVRALGPGESMVLRDADAVRDFVHVEDVARGLIGLCERASVPAVVNISTGIGTSVRELAQRIVAAFDKDIHIDEIPEKSSIAWSVGNPSRFNSTLGWAPLERINEAIDQLKRQN